MKISVRKIIFYSILLVFLGIFCYAGYRMLDIIGNYREIEVAYDHIAELAVQTVPTEPNSSDAEDFLLKETSAAERSDLTDTPGDSTDYGYCTDQIQIPIVVDFDVLREINPDIVGWLYCEGTSINYPVLQGETNDDYLYTRYDGTYCSGGSIFMDYRCESNFTGDYTVIYGHNMLADSMFNSLDYFRKQSYLDKHSRLFYLTPSGTNYCLEVICTNLTAYKDDLRLFELRDDERNLELIRSKAEADTGIEASNDDQLVLLATCTYDYKNARCTLLCKAIKIGS